MIAILLALSLVPPPVVTLHTTFQNPPWPEIQTVSGYVAHVFERHDLGPQPYAQPKISAPAPSWYWLTFEGEEWTVWTDWPQPGQVIYLCVASYNATGESDCVTQEAW